MGSGVVFELAGDSAVGSRSSCITAIQACDTVGAMVKVTKTQATAQ